MSGQAPSEWATNVAVRGLSSGRGSHMTYFLSHPFACIQALWLKAKLIAWVMSVTGLGKVVSDQNPLPCN